MDFWEGFFLGGFWTDSDYKNKNHPVFYMIIGMVTGLLIPVFALFPHIMSRVLILPAPAHFILFAILFISLPPISGYYWKIPPAFRVFVLFAYFFQYLFAVLGSLQVLIYRIAGSFDVSLASLPGHFLEFVDEKMSTMAALFNFGKGLTGTLISFVAALFAVGLIILAGLLLLCMIAPIVVLFVKASQRICDYLWYRYFFRRNKYALSEVVSDVSENLPPSLRQRVPVRPFRRLEQRVAPVLEDERRRRRREPMNKPYPSHTPSERAQGGSFKHGTRKPSSSRRPPPPNVEDL